MKRALWILPVVLAIMVWGVEAAQKVSPKEAVEWVEQWLSYNGDAFDIGGDRVRTVIEYERTYLMILSPKGWLTTPKVDDKNFRPLSFGGGKLDRENFENSFWGQTSGAKNGKIVYENPKADQPRQRIYRGLTDMPYDNKIKIPLRTDRGVEKIHRGTASNDVFVFDGPSNYDNGIQDEYLLIGNGGSDIYDINNGFTVRVAVKIDKKNPREKNVILLYAYSIGRGATNELVPLRKGNDLILAFVRDMDKTRLRIVDWYLGPRHRPDRIVNSYGTTHEADEIARAAANAKRID